MNNNLVEFDLNRIIKESIDMVINEATEGPYWYCEYEDNAGNTISKIIYAKTTPGAFKHGVEMGIRIGMEPKFETLRGATKEEVRQFKKMIKSRIK